MTRPRLVVGFALPALGLLVAFILTAETLRPQGGAVVRADTAALLLSEQDGGAVRLATLAMAHPGGEAVTVRIEIDGTSLAEGHDRAILRADVFVYVLGASNETLAHAANRIALDLDRVAEQVRRTGVRLAVTVRPPPGRHRLRVLVRSETGAFGLASAELHLPQSGEDGLLAPWFVPSGRRWVSVVSEADEAAWAAAWGWTGATAVPCRPVVASGSDPEVLVVLSAGTVSETVTPALLLEKGDGTVTPVDLEAELVEGAPAGVTVWRARLRIAKLEPGMYRARAAVGELRSPELALLLTPRSAAGDPDLEAWTEIDLESLAPGIELPPETVDLGQESDPAENEIVGDYLQALGQLVLSDRGAALRRLYELEIRVIESLSPSELERIETKTLAALFDGPAEGLLPVILLHVESIRGYRGGGRSALVGHAEQMALRLTRTWVERVSGEAVRGDAVSILAGVAAELRRLGTLARAEAIYRQALALDPDNEDLVLAIAAIQERWGRFADAARTLETIDLKRLGAEARLRLAVNLQRTRRRGGAEHLFRKLLHDADASPWTRIVAAQELTRAQVAAERFRDAADTLRQALRYWPDHRALRLQRAYVLDRLERPEEATRLAEQVGRREAGRELDERYRYNEWPETRFDAGLDEVSARSARHTADLRRALERFLGGEDP